MVKKRRRRALFISTLRKALWESRIRGQVVFNRLLAQIVTQQHTDLSITLVIRAEMVNACCVVGCNNRSHDRNGKPLRNGIRFFNFPAWRQNQGSLVCDMTKRRRMAWVKAVRRKSITFDNISRNMLVCSKHFHKGKPAYEMFEGDPDWAPSLQLGPSGVSPTADRFKHNKQTTEETQAGGAETPEPDDCSSATFPDSPCTATSDDPYASTSSASSPDVAASSPSVTEEQECSFCLQKSAEIENLMEENRRLKEELSKKKMDENFLKDDDMKVRYYTGLPCFAALMSLLTQLLPYLQEVKNLSPFQMLLLTLMRLKLSLPNQHIRYLFGIDQKTVSATFRDTVSVMFTRLSPLVHWPERHHLQATMPQQFVDAFRNRVAVIVDCFEIPIERRSNLKDVAQTFAHYKHQPTLKYLICFTPQGAVSFISKGWGGHISDKQVTENRGFLNKLQPGDLVLADQHQDCGFDITDSVPLVCAEVKTPIFSRRCHLCAMEVQETRRLAHLRVHVERVLGVVHSKFTILNSTIPLSMVVPCKGENLSLLDKIVCVCCALTNMCESAVEPGS